MLDERGEGGLVRAFGAQLAPPGQRDATERGDA